MKTQAAVLFEYGKDWEVEELELDGPKAGEVMVKLAASGLCHSDEHVRIGDIQVEALPFVGGHEGAGIVEEVGPGVTTVQPGDHVVLGFIPACGRCRWCASGRSNICDLGAGLLVGLQVGDNTSRHHVRGQDARLMCCIGTFSPYTTVNEASVVKIDDDLPLDKAALVGCGVTTGWGSSVYAAEVKPGETVVIVGIGGVGVNAVQGAKLAGATHVIAIDPVEFKREQAQVFGATHTAASIEEAMPLITDLTRGVMADKAVVTIGVGDGNLLAPAMALVSKGGRVVHTAVAPLAQIDAQLSLIDLTLFEKQLVGSLFGSANIRSDIPKLLRLYQDGQLKLDELITQTYTLEQVNQGYEDLRNNKNIRGLITYS